MKNMIIEGERTVYRSRWDWSTWLILVVCAVACLLPVFLGAVVEGVVLTVVFLGLIVAGILGTYYVVAGDKLVVYTLFIPETYPITKISQIKPTKSILSAPATSLTHRIAISFTDRKVMKSVMPLIISPVRQPEFLAQLRSINPAIKL
ncbi:MAG: PH domain-containing protein [Bacteroides sp.]|nr:PH domain-containing protein [Bacteroides sp.]